MRWIVAWSLQFRVLVVGLAVAMMGLGVAQLRQAPVDVFPEFAPTYVQIQTEALGLSAAEVEQLITVPMEQLLLNGVAWLDEIRSESLPGLSSIVLIFEPGTDPLRARQVVQERLTQARDLPKVGKPAVMIQPLSSASRVMLVQLSSTELSLIDTSVLARWTVRPRLMGVPGVANVAIWGQRERQLQVQVDPERLRAQGVSLDQVIETTANALWVSPLSFVEASTPGSGGFIDSPNQRLGIQHLLPIRTPDELAQVAVEGCTGGLPTARRHVDANCPPPPQARPPLRLGDVATVVEDHQPLIGDAVAGDGGGLLLVVEKFPEANTLAVTRGVEDALAAMRPGLSGVEIDTSIFRPASYIEAALGNLGWALLLGLLLVVALLGAFLFDWRVALISLAALPLSLVAAGLVLHWRGATINTMILAGLVVALGVLVDDAVVDVDTIARRLRQQRREGGARSTAAVILEAALEARGAGVYGTLVLLVAVLPLLFLAGPTGAFARPLALAYALAVLASLAVALTVTPALALLLLARAPLARRRSPLVPWLQRGYGAALARVVARPRWAYAAVALVVAAGLAAVPFLGSSLLPSLQDRDLLIHWEGAPGTSRPEMTRITALAMRELRSIPGVRNAGAHVGRAVTSDQMVGINAGEIWVSLDPAADYDATLAAVREVVDGYPGLRREVLTYPQEKLRELRAGAGDTMVVRLYGQDPEVLRAKAEEVRQLLGGIDGVADGRVELPAEEPQVEIQVDLAAAQRHGLTPGAVRRAAAALVSGLEVGNLFEEQKVFEVMVVGTPALRHSVESIRALPIETPTGGQVRLGEVAQVRIAPAPVAIAHDAVSRFVDVSADVRGRSALAVAGDIEQRLRAVPFPHEYHAEVQGDYAAQRAAQQRLLAAALAAALGVYLLLQAAFASWRLAAVVYLTLPMALVGGLLAAFAGGGVLSLGALAGFLAVLGIAGRNAIMLVSHYQRLAREEGEPFGPGLVLRGARERLAPILLTALATGLALAPLVVRGGIPGHEVVRPVAVVILGGLVTSTLLTLFVLPALYLRFAPTAQPEPEPAGAQPRLSPAAGAAAD